MNTNKLQASAHKDKIEQYVKKAEQLRRSSSDPVDASFAEVIQAETNLTVEELYEDLGIDPNTDTLDNLFTMPDTSIRWLVPEIIRDALRLGLRKAPIWPNLVAAEETVSQLAATVPHWNMSDAKPKIVGEAETIGLGTVSVGSKSIKLRKIGRGIKISYEAKQYCSMNVISIFLQDFGVKLGQGLDTLAIDCLINGDQANGSESAPVIGVATPGTLVYRDLLKLWIRMSRLGKAPSIIISGEDAALETLNLPEFKNKNSGTPDHKLNFKTPVPQQTDYFIHGSVPDSQSIIIDPNSSLIKYNAQPLLVESEKIVSNQTEATYATLTTGFANMFRDSRVVIDQSLDFSGNGFPAYMDPTTEEITVFD